MGLASPRSGARHMPLRAVSKTVRIKGLGGFVTFELFELPATVAAK